MRFLFVGDVASGRSIIEAMARKGDLAGVAFGSEHQRAQARGFGVEILDARDLNAPATITKLHDLNLDLIVNFNSTIIFREPLLACPRIGAINFHPGLLPDYAGVNVHQWAILNGERETGATIHVMTSGIDEGAILAQETVPIQPNDTGLTLYIRLLRVGAILTEGVLESVAVAGFSRARPQPLPHRRLYKAKDHPCGRIAFSKPVAEVDGFIRALSYRPFESPLGVPFIKTPNGSLELASVSTTAIEPGAAEPPGTVVALDDERIEIACLDGCISARACYLNGKRVGFEQAARDLGLHVGLVV